MLNSLINKYETRGKNYHGSLLLSTNIIEYDIKHAHASAIRLIKGDIIYENLMKMEKKDRNITIGYMKRDEKGLGDEINKLVLKWFNDFITLNNIKDKQILETTPDSILLYNKIPTKLFVEKNMVEFRDKGALYSSLAYHDNKLYLYNSMNKNLRIKGIREEISNNSEFAKRFLKNIFGILEKSIHDKDRRNTMKKLKTLKLNYFKNDNIEIYRELSNENMFRYTIDNQDILFNDISDKYDISSLNLSDNYLKHILPFIRLYL